MNRMARKGSAIEKLLAGIAERSKIKEVAIYCDAATHDSIPGILGMGTYGFIVKGMDGQVLYSEHGTFGSDLVTTEAELSVVLFALEWVKNSKILSPDVGVEVYTDCVPIMEHMSSVVLDTYSTRPVWRKLLAIGREMKKSFAWCKVTWIPREENRLADGLCRNALRKHLGKEEVPYDRYSVL